MARLGVELESFGAKTIKLESLPAFLETDDPLELVNQLVHEMREDLGPGRGMRLADDSLAASVCRRAAGAETSPATEENVRQLLAQLFQCDLPYCCPRGNPTLVQMGYAELERKFGR